ncbi:MAG: DUF262 domain-containing protein [Candidatus Paceibacterota bacterium]
MNIKKDKKALDKLYRRRDRYDLQPDFQREEVWDEKKEQKLMDTILKNWDIPKVYLRANDAENFDCVDGQQRMTAIFKFYDNELKLPKESGEYVGLFYKDLPDKVKDIFDDYELDLVLIYDATEEELRNLFARLQLGVPLNSAEKLNAMSGNMRNFVKELSAKDFFKNKISLKNKRFAFQAISSQICLIEMNGIRDAKFKDMEDFYSRETDFDNNSFLAKKIVKVLTEMDKIFPVKTSLFRSRSAIISFFIILSEMIKNGLSLNSDYRKSLKDFYIKFQKDLKEEIEKGSEAIDAELMVYQSKINQAPDSKESISKRHEILKRRLSLYEPKFKKYLELKEKEEDFIELQNKENIKKSTDSIIKEITEINKVYSVQKKEDMFKTTSEGLRCSVAISSPVKSKKEFKEFIDCVYKLIYEGSGYLKRISNNIITDCPVLIDIKDLRTDFFHDIEHGEKKKIEKKKNKISSIYKKYINAPTFGEIDNTQFNIFQIKILEEIKGAIEKIKKEIKIV